MPFIQLTLLYSLLIFFTGDKVVEPMKETEGPNIILQSKDGGRTWQDISLGLPETEQPKGFFAGTSEVYLRTNGGELYSSKSDLKTMVWEKENIPGMRSTSIAFNPSGVTAYSYDGYIYQKKTSSETWLPVYTSLKSTSLQPHSVAGIFETSDGAVFLSTGKSLSKSIDQARSWKSVQKGWVGDIVEADGALLATGQHGIMRSTDNGDNWELVISEGGVGIAIERIDGGFAAISFNQATQSRRIHVSFDDGKTWQAIGDGLPPSANISSVKQMRGDLFVGHPDGIYRSSDMGKKWHLVHTGFGNVFEPSKFVPLKAADGREKVFKLYVSGGVLYVVGVSQGC